MESLDIKEGLSYYDYWLNKDTWTLDEAIGILVRYHVVSRKWSEVDDIDVVASGHHKHIYQMINRYIQPDDLVDETPDHIGCTVGEIEIVYDKNKSTIAPKIFIKWAYLMKLDVPRELLEYIGELKAARLTWDFVNKMMCQAVAKTLWDANATLSIEDIMWHPAIQKHADGKTTPASTLRKWISEVDPRSPEGKPGPKKKGPSNHHAT